MAIRPEIVAGLSQSFQGLSGKLANAFLNAQQIKRQREKDKLSAAAAAEDRKLALQRLELEEQRVGFEGQRLEQQAEQFDITQSFKAQEALRDRNAKELGRQQQDEKARQLRMDAAGKTARDLRMPVPSRGAGGGTRTGGAGGPGDLFKVGTITPSEGMTSGGLMGEGKPQSPIAASGIDRQLSAAHTMAANLLDPENEADAALLGELQNLIVEQQELFKASTLNPDGMPPEAALAFMQKAKPAIIRVRKRAQQRGVNTDALQGKTGMPTWRAMGFASEDAVIDHIAASHDIGRDEAEMIWSSGKEAQAVVDKENPEAAPPSPGGAFGPFQGDIEGAQGLGASLMGTVESLGRGIASAVPSGEEGQAAMQLAAKHQQMLETDPAVKVFADNGFVPGSQEMDIAIRMNEIMRQPGAPTVAFSRYSPKVLNPRIIRGLSSTGAPFEAAIAAIEQEHPEDGVAVLTAFLNAIGAAPAPAAPAAPRETGPSVGGMPELMAPGVGPSAALNSFGGQL